MNLCLLSASEIISKIKKKEISSTEVAKSFIDQIHKLEKNVKAWTFFDEDLFLKKAKDSDSKLSSGKSLGSLHGLPVAIKDIFQTEDMPTLNGISIRENHTNRHDSSVVEFLKKA
jgi:Asp-tRNA(Asn)/Glu-tRNA(Gln) amidotransferase A subunit family amidase